MEMTVNVLQDSGRKGEGVRRGKRKEGRKKKRKKERNQIKFQGTSLSRLHLALPQPKIDSVLGHAFA